MTRIFKLLIILISVLCIGISCSQNSLRDSDSNKSSDVTVAEVSTKYARILFEQSTYDFGKIKQGEVVKHTFKFKNDGDTALYITNASASCGCTVPQWPKEAVQKGDTGVIQVQFNSTGKSGVQNKTIMITANTLPNISTIVLKGEVEAPKVETK
ncbi:MAG: DUF1573 domain-containing protein [Bacteroidota bacterium]|nr:DUF1573 domain-containing protein [Bacteroidota bacterium]